MKKLIPLFFISLLLCCSQVERDNIYDPDGVNYLGGINAVSSSSGGGVSSSSFVASSSSGCSTSELADGTINYCGQTYKTVVIGTQTWMAENLNYNTSGSKCYGNNSANCTKYGRLYNWATAMKLPNSCNNSTCSGQVDSKHQGICPSGWHIPTNAEWTTLENYVGGSSTAGRYLKATSGWYNCGPSGSGSSYLCEDSYGFAALPDGYGYSDGSFDDVGYYGYWWSASEGNASYAYSRIMHYNYEDAYYNYNSKSFLFSVRCLQDDFSNPSSSSGASSSSSSYAISSSSSSSIYSSSSYRSSSSIDYSSSSIGEYGPLEYEGQTYKTVVIGEQIWMAENLNYKASGSKCYGEGGISYVNDIIDGIEVVLEFTLSDTEIQSNCDKYGRLYDWATAMALDAECNSTSCSGQVQSKHQGICPDGWHIPSNADWDKLLRFVDGTSGTTSPYNSATAGNYLKATSGWDSGNGLDTYGFAALPGGSGYSDSIFYSVGNSGYWWSTYESTASSAYSRYMSYTEGVHYSSGYYGKSYMYSIRCIKD